MSIGAWGVLQEAKRGAGLAQWGDGAEACVAGVQGTRGEAVGDEGRVVGKAGPWII